jgi:CBS domain-containing protein
LVVHDRRKTRDALLYKFLEEAAADCMTRSVKTVTRDLTMRTLLLLFERDDFNAYPVVEGAYAVGLVTKLDFLKCFAFSPAQMVPRYDDLMNKVVADVMSPTFIYVGEATKLTRVLQLMVEHRVRSIPVIDAERLVGIVSREDVMRSLKRCTGGDG